MSQTTKSFEEKCKVFFDQANGGNPITVGQLARVIRSASPNFQGSDQEIAEMFFEVDVNNDKLVDWNEFSTALFAKDPKEVTRAELQTLFKSIDKDGSGKLDKTEIINLVKEQGLSITDEELEDIIKEADVNGDGLIDFEELLRLWMAK